MRAALPNFSKGEIGPELYGRIDTPQYAAGLKRARNFLVQKYGGVTFRPGTRLVGKVDAPNEGLRLLPFQFSISQSYVLVMQNGSMRPVARGGFVVEQDTKITAITLGNPTRLWITNHGYVVGDRLFLDGIEGTVELNKRFVTVTAVPDSASVLIDVDSSGFGAFISSDGVDNAVPPPPPPAPPVVPPTSPPPAPPPVGGGGGLDDQHWKFQDYPPWYIPPG